MNNEDQLKKLHETLLEILSEFDHVCQRHNIQYFLDSGSALGAVRHGGFIPWDDDVDVGMMRCDYERFLRVAPNEISKKFIIQNHENDAKYFKHHAKMRKLGTYFPESYTSMLKYQGIFIDIFPFDYVPQNKIIRKIHFLLIKYFRNRSYLRRFKSSRNSIYKKIVGVFFDLFSEPFLESCYQNLISIFKSGTQVTCYEYMVCQKNLKLFNKEWLSSTIQINFAGKNFQIMRGYDAYLHEMYHDYMQLPPEDKRIYHCDGKIIFDSDKI